LSTTIPIQLRGRDFLDIADLKADELLAVIELAEQMRAGSYNEKPLQGRHVALVFEKPSLRTRPSFEAGIARLGGTWTTLGQGDVQLGSRETFADAARVLERYACGIVARLHRHADLLEMAQAASVPLVNALTDGSHPCQVVADLMTIRQHRQTLAGQKVAFVGDGNNVAHSLIEASALLGFALVMVSPPAYRPRAEVLERARSLAGTGFQVQVTSDLSAVDGADVVYTDVWTSMGQEAETEVRRSQFAEYQVDSGLMERAQGAIFMHCLPAHRGEEVAAEVIDGPASVVFDQAENRMYAQMALMTLLF
jgi:ornithine carbamoyltransferase